MPDSKSVANDGLGAIGTMLEELGSRFDLVIEAASAFGGRLDALRDELFGQFAEVGSQIRFISEQIGENRKGIGAMRADLGAEMIRLGETLGKTRVEFREQMAELDISLKREIDTRTAQAQDNLSKLAVASVDAATTRNGHHTAALKQQIGASADTTTKKLAAEIGKTSKLIESLARKLERFDDRITVSTRDQDQRLRKLERKAAR